MAPWLWGQHDWLNDVCIFTVWRHHGCEGSMTDWMMSVSLLCDGTMAVRAAWLHDVRIFTAWRHHGCKGHMTDWMMSVSLLRDGCEGSMTDWMMSVSLLRDGTMAVRAAWLTAWCPYLYCRTAPWLWGQHDWLNDVCIFTAWWHHGCEGSMTDCMMSVSLPCLSQKKL